MKRLIEADQALTQPEIVPSLYGPTAGTGRMLTVAGTDALTPITARVLRDNPH